MKLTILSTIICISFLTACGGGTTSTNSANSNAANKVNSNSAVNQTTPVSTDTTPVTMDYDAFGKVDTATLESYKGRTMIVKGGDIRQWNEDLIVVSPKPYKFVRCNGSFQEYADSIKIWQKRIEKNQFDTITADVKGTVKDVESRSETVITLENCTLLKLDK